MEELKKCEELALIQEEEIKREIQRIEELEERLLQDEELASKYSIQIDLKKDTKCNYFFDRIHYISNEVPAITETEEQEELPTEVAI